MLKRLLIAVLALSFVMAFTGTAFSDVYPQQVDAQKAGNRFENQPISDGFSNLNANQPASRPEGNTTFDLPAGISIPAPPLSYFCLDLWYDAGAAVYTILEPTGVGPRDFMNVRYTADENFSCTLKTFWLAIYGPAMVGTPDMMVYLWDDDGFGNPGTALDSIFVPNASLPTAYTWMAFDFTASPNVPVDGWIFEDGEEYHYGISVRGTAGDELAPLMDDASSATGGRTQMWDPVGSAWVTYLAFHGIDRMMIQSSEYCAGEIPFTDCYTQSYWANFWNIFSTPHSGGAPIIAQAMRFDVGGPETLVNASVVIYDLGDGSYGDNDLIISVTDDDAGLPGPTTLFTTTVLAGSYGPGSWVTVPVGMVIDQTFHITVEVVGTPGVSWEFIGADDGLNGTGRSSTHYNGAWMQTGALYAVGDVNFLIDADLCRDQFSDCEIASHFGNNWFTFSMGGDGFSNRSAAGVQMFANGSNCQINDVSIVFDDYFSDAADFIYDTKISVYTDIAGEPGTELASVLITPGNYNAWPAYTIADFSALDVYVTGDYWAVVEYLVPAGDSSTIGFNSDNGTFDNGGRSAALWNPSTGLSGWVSNLNAYGTDYGWDITTAICCTPFPDLPRTCDPLTDAGWGTFQGSQARTGASQLSVGDAWCNLNLNWSYDGPLGVTFTGPVIYGDKAVCSFTESYVVFDIITGAVLYDLNSASGDGFLIGLAISSAPTVANVGGTDIMFIAGGSKLSTAAIDFNTGAVLWQNTLMSGAGIFGKTSFTSFTLINDGTMDVLYHTTDNGLVLALEAATGALYTGWATNPIALTGHPFASGATDGTSLFYATQDAGTEGDIYSVDAATGMINWTLQGAGGLAAPLETGYAYPEGFRAGVAYNQGVLYTVSWANDGGISAHPIDGFFYSIDAGTGNYVIPPTKTNRAIYATPVIDANHVYAPTLTQWVGGTDPTGGNLIAFHKTTGIQVWGAKTPDDANYYSSGILSCEQDDIAGGLLAPDLLFIFNDEGFFECYNTTTGEQMFSRRVDHGGGSGDIGMFGAMAMTATDGLHMIFADFYGGLYDFKLGGDRARLEIQAFNPQPVVEFGPDPALSVNAGPIIVNTGCTDLILSSATVDELTISGSTRPDFTSGYVTEEIMDRANAISDFMQRESFLSKYRRPVTDVLSSTDVASNVKSLDRGTKSSRLAAGIPVWFVSLDQPIAGTTILPGDTIDLLITVNQPLISRGPQSVFIAWESNDPDYFLNAAADAAGNLPEIKLTIVGGCLIDTTELNFGMGAANIQLVTNSGRLGTGDWDPHGFEIDGDGASYYQGSYIFADETYALALNTQDWSSGGGEADAWASMQADPNYCDNACKPALTAGVIVGAISTDGLTYSNINADMVCKTYIDSVENFDGDPDPLVLDWDWGDFDNKSFDDTLSMGLLVNTRTFGVVDLPELANLTFEIMEFNERNGDSINDWYFGQITDYDVGSDVTHWDQSISTAWSRNSGATGAWGSIKIPFGCGTLGAGQDFDYNPIYSVKGLDGATALFDIGAYFDSAYIYLSTPGEQPHQPFSADGEMHTGYTGHNFLPNSTFSIGIANFGIDGLADATSGAELADMAHFVNQWAGFGRGDVNNDGGINLADIIYLAGNVNNAGPGAIPFAHLGDVNADGSIDAGDINYLVNYYFNCGPCPMGDWMF